MRGDAWSTKQPRYSGETDAEALGTVDEVDVATRVGAGAEDALLLTDEDDDRAAVAEVTEDTLLLLEETDGRDGVVDEAVEDDDDASDEEDDTDDTEGLALEALLEKVEEDEIEPVDGLIEPELEEDPEDDMDETDAADVTPTVDADVTVELELTGTTAEPASEVVNTLILQLPPHFASSPAHFCPHSESVTR